MPKNELQTANAPCAIGPYAQAIMAHGFIFTSGQISLDPKSNTLVSGGITEQTVQVLENLKNVLASGHAGFEDVVKTTVFLKDLEDFATVNEIYGRYFAPPYPARSCVQASRLPRDVLIEMEAIAATK